MYKEYVTNDRSCHLKTATNQVMTDDQELPGWCPPHVPPSTPSHHTSTNSTAHPSVTEAEVTQETGAQNTAERPSKLVHRQIQSQTHCSLRSGWGRGPVTRASGNCVANRRRAAWVQAAGTLKEEVGPLISGCVTSKAVTGRT